MFDKQKLIKSFIVFIIEIVVLFTFYFLLVGRYLPFPFSLILSILGSLFMLIFVGSFLSAKVKYSEWHMMKKALIARGINEFKDGEKIVVFGQIFSYNQQPIISPFTRKKSVFYTYDIFRMVWIGSGDDRRVEKESDYGGLYLTPSYINSTLGKIRLLAYPTLQGFEEKTYSYSDADAYLYNNAYAFIQNTNFEEFGKIGIAKLGKAYQMIKEILTDNDGYVRKDTKYATESFDLKTRLLSEQTVKEGENVSLLGIWSSSKQGIITDMNKCVATLSKGLPEQAILTAKREFLKKICEGLLILFIVNTIIGVFWLILNKGSEYGTVTITETRNRQVVRNEIINQSEREDNDGIGITIDDPTQTTVEWLSYTNVHGMYKYRYPSNWKHNEIINKDLNTPDQKVYSVSSLITNPDYASMFGSLSFSYQIDGGLCIEKDESMQDWVNLKVKVGDQTVDAYERQELNKSVNQVVYERVIFLPKEDYCYKFLILDQQGNPNSEIFKQVLFSFEFVD